VIAAGGGGGQGGGRGARGVTGAGGRVALASMLLLVSFELAGQLLIKPLDLYTATVW